MTRQCLRSRAPTTRSPGVRNVMVANWGGNTAPERKLRSALHRAGLRFFKDCKPLRDLRCTADLVFPRRRTCVFVDGCFWHGCRRHFKRPKTNSEWWEEKINSNRARDRRQTARLSALGWNVIRVWEHDLEPEILKSTVARIEVAIHSFRAGGSA